MTHKIEKNPHYDNAVWNPLMSFQLALDKDNKPCLVFSFTGETGQKMNVIFQDPSYYNKVVFMTQYAEKMLTAAIDEGFLESVNRFMITKSDSDVAPDDISSLFDD